MCYDAEGGPAFPGIGTMLIGNGGEQRPIQVKMPGMTLRDWFAGQVLASIGRQSADADEMADVAFCAYTQADAMLKERSK